MAEPSQIMFSFKEIAAALVKQQGLKEGIWGISVKFGLKAMNIGDSENDVRPAAIIPILEIGLQKFDKESNLTVDAAKINPKSKNKPKP
jgi:hypothetical protein